MSQRGLLRLWRTAAAWIVMAVTAGTSARAGDTAPTATSPKGQIVLRQNTYDGASFYLYVPYAATSARPLPLVITSHSTVTTADQEIGLDCSGAAGCCTESPFASTKWYQLAENAGNVNLHNQPFVVAAPAMSSANGGLVNPWTGESRAAVDQRRILAIYDQIADTEAAAWDFAVDRSRVLLTGWSGGGIPTYYVGTRNPALFRMILSRQGNFDAHMFDTAGPLDPSLAVAILAGVNDGIVPLPVHRVARDFFISRGYPAVFAPPADPHIRTLPDAEFPGVPGDHYCHSLVAWDTFMDYVEAGNPVVPGIADVATDPDGAAAGEPYTKQLTLLQGTPPITWSVLQGPIGVQVSAAGRVSGWTPAAADRGRGFSFSVQATNAVGSDAVTWQVIVAPTGDFDRDGDVDLRDFRFFVVCFSGPNQPILPGCAAADLDSDADADLIDYLSFYACFNGQNRPPACE